MCFLCTSVSDHKNQSPRLEAKVGCYSPVGDSAGKWVEEGVCDGVGDSVWCAHAHKDLSYFSYLDVFLCIYCFVHINLYVRFGLLPFTIYLYVVG